MGIVLRGIPVEQVTDELKRQGYTPGQRVDVAVEESLGDVARRMSDRAAERGLTEQVLAEILAEKK